MFDPRTAKLADLLVHYCIAARPGEWVHVRSDVAGLPLVQATVESLTRAGANPTVQLHSDGVEEAFLRHADDTQLGWVSPVEELIGDQVDARIIIVAAENTRALTGIEPRRQQIAANARRGLMTRMRERGAAGLTRWVITQFPTNAYAQDSDMSLADYADFLYAATFADQPDPVACWREVHVTQQRLVEWLAGKQEVVVRGPHVDLTLSIAGRTFINSDGKRNMPSGEIFTGPVEDSVNGWIRATFPALRGGREVDGVELEFRDGQVVRATAAKNEEYLLSQLESDPGARVMGEFAVGTNYRIQRFTKSILFDEKIGGTIHVALGAGYPETGSRNQSAVHWDFLCDMRRASEILVDGVPFYRNGQFVI